MSRWISPTLLNAIGVLGMNRRNIAYIGRYNDRRNYPLVDNKLTTKLIAADADLAVPDLIGVIRAQHEIESIEDVVADLSGFVAKPAQGSGGKGILIVTGQSASGYIKPNGETATLAELKRHLTNTISGLHSLGGRADVAFLEQLVEVNTYLGQYSHEGVPDIRLIVFKGFPVMGMLRLATVESDGKANLHQGALGVGIDLATGRAIQAVQHDLLVTKHPDTGIALDAIEIPNWPDLMRLATSCYEATNLGYLGCDIVIDQHRGPLILELNARPGLSIQIANNAGLLPRLRVIEGLNTRKMTIEDRIDFARKEFGVAGLSLASGF